jgi:hypothetical protein
MSRERSTAENAVEAGVRNFAELDAFLEALKPLSPYGRAAKARMGLCSDREALDQEYGRIEAFLRWRKNRRLDAAKAEAALGRVPLLDFDLRAQALGPAELLLLKRFLLCGRSTLAALPEALRRAVDGRWECDGLVGLLSKGSGEDEESFRLSDVHHPGLKRVRRGIGQADAGLKRLRERVFLGVRKRTGLDFFHREFVIADAQEARRFYGDKTLFIEPHDGSRVIIKPVLGPAGLKLGARREKLACEERRLEAEVLAALSADVSAQADRIERLCLALSRADLLLAKARLAQEQRLARPVLQEFGSAIRLRKARHVPLELRNRALGLDYTPLSCDLESRVGVLHGSNMGGKTAALKTAALLQLLAQCGLFVPAESFETVLFERIDYVGEGGSEPVAGLSSFGLELHGLRGLIRDRSLHRLVLMDEFGKATSSREGAALLCATLALFSRNAGYYALASTHLSGLSLPPGGAAYRMLGFDEKAFMKSVGAPACCGKSCEAAEADDRSSERVLPEALRRIHRFMRYELIADDAQVRSSDALKVARVLGLDADVVDAAERFLESKTEFNPADPGKP